MTPPHAAASRDLLLIEYPVGGNQLNGTYVNSMNTSRRRIGLMMQYVGAVSLYQTKRQPKARGFR